MPGSYENGGNRNGPGVQGSALGNPYCLPIPKIEIRDVLGTRRVKPQLVKFLQKERCMLMQGTKLGRLPTVKPGRPGGSINGGKKGLKRRPSVVWRLRQTSTSGEA